MKPLKIGLPKDGGVSMHTEIVVTRWEGVQARECVDAVALEEPLEILVNGESLAVTMRTPGEDFALVAGFLFAESQIRSAWDIRVMGYCGKPGEPLGQNRLDVSLRPDGGLRAETPHLQRNFLATSSCGVCGKTRWEEARCVAPPLPNDNFRVPRAVLGSLSEQMRAAQRTFDRTGGLHAAGLFDGEGALLSLSEDVGRHNAVDKIIGTEVLAGRLPLGERILLVSGRLSFEIIQKAAMARIPVVCAVSAPSSLAVSVARDLNMTLIGFLRGETMNVYAGAERLYL